MKKVLILTNKDDVTVDFVVKELQAREIPYYRLNTEDIPDKLSVCFDFQDNTFELFDKVKGLNFNLLDFNSVYYRRPQLNELNHISNTNHQEQIYLKNELMFILEGIYKILNEKYWLNNVYQIREAENKIYQIQIAKQIGFNIPNSLITNQHSNVVKFMSANDYDCIIKPIKSGNMKDDNSPKAIFTSKITEEQIRERERIESFPIYIQKNISKKYDIRAIVIGDKVFTAEIHSQCNESSQIDWRKSKQILTHKKHELPIHIREMCVKLTQQLKLNYSAIDLIYTHADEYFFLESNPNGQWAWIEKRLGYPLSREIVNLLVKGGE